MITQGFDRVSFSQAQLHDALRVMCPSALKAYDSATTKVMRESWSRNNPTRFCCYFVSEMCYWFAAPVGSRAMSLAVPNDATLHRYVEWPDGRIVDLTCDQFEITLDYSQAKARMFMQTGGVGPSKRARSLANLLGYPAWQMSSLL